MFARVFSSCFGARDMLVRRPVQQLDAARASSPRICADLTRVAADVRAAAHLWETAAAPEVLRAST